MDFQIVWFVLLTVLFLGYVVLDGFDLGVGMLHLGAKTENERRISLNSIGPVWDANEVWLITAGGALFAAFPDVYATVFSGFYIAFILFLLFIIGRAVSIEFRSKIEGESWKKFWDFIFNLSSYFIVILLGVALGNIVSGVPIAENKEFAGSFVGLLHPYAIFLALTAVLLMRMHGRLYLLNKTEGDYRERLKGRLNLSWILFLIFVAILTVWTISAYPHMTENMFVYPVWFVAPALLLLFIILIPILAKKEKFFGAFLSSSLVIAMMIIITAIGIYPNLVYSSSAPENSLTVFNASSSELTLYTMFIIACIGVPLMLIYKFIVYTAFRGKVKLDSTSY